LEAFIISGLLWRRGPIPFAVIGPENKSGDPGGMVL
jgi:hypothetical protein